MMLRKNSQGLNHDINSGDCKCDRVQAVSSQSAAALGEPLHRNIAMISGVDRLTSLGRSFSRRKSHVEEGGRTPQTSFRASYACGASSRGSRQASRGWTPRNSSTSCSHRDRPHKSRQTPRRRGSEGARRGARSPRWRAPPHFRRSEIGQNIAPAIQVGHSAIAPLRPVFVCSRPVNAVIPHAAPAFVSASKRPGR
jgi:hypothetical protein